MVGSLLLRKNLIDGIVRTGRAEFDIELEQVLRIQAQLTKMSDDRETILKEIQVQGDLVRQLKAAKESKEKVIQRLRIPS